MNQDVTFQGLSFSTKNYKLIPAMNLKPAAALVLSLASCILIPACAVNAGRTSAPSVMIARTNTPSVAVLELKRAHEKLSGSVQASRYGLVPDTGLDSGPAFRRLLAAATPGSVIRLRKGRYDIWSQHGTTRPWQHSNSDPQTSRIYGILLEGLRDVTLDGAGSELVFHGTQTGIGLAFCTNITLRGFSMDWARPEMSQGTVLESGPDYVVVQMHPDTPAKVESGRLVFAGEGWVQGGTSTMEFDPKTGGPAYQRADLPRVGAAAEVCQGIFRCENKTQ